MADTNSITMPLDKGCATAIDPSLLKPGYLQEAEGVAYVSGDPAAHKVGGRTLFNAVSPASADVNGINFVSFDATSDYVTAQMGGTLYSAVSTVGTFASVRTGLTATAEMIDRTKFADSAYFCNGTDANWVYKSDNTTFVWGLNPQTVAPTGSLGGTGITGTYLYWTTEYDSTNGVESAFTGTPLTQTPANQTVTITKPATINASATHWRLYRTIAGGVYPTGWLVATTAIGTATYADSTTDQALVLLSEYDRVAINDIPEPQNLPPPVFRSVATFEGSLVGVAARSLYFSETATPHYFPASYVIPFRPTWGGQARCVRTVNKVCMVLFDHNAFRVNTLPKAADSFFDPGIVQERVANYGTHSPLGACVFSGWGGVEMLFFASSAGPMLTDGNSFDQAVLNIDWTGLVPSTSLPTCVVIDNPQQYRVEMFYEDSEGAWRALHFYYSQSEVTQERGFPELVWTGPHLVPGPGTYGILSCCGQVWTGSRAADGFVYKEDVGYSDAANLYDSSGTVPFRLRTGRFYADGINSQCTVGRGFISKADTGGGNYSVTLSSWNEGDVGEPTPTTRSIDAAVLGATSDDFNRNAQSHDVRVVRDDASYMPPINNITLMVKDVGEFVKTNRR